MGRGKGEYNFTSEPKTCHGQTGVGIGWLPPPKKEPDGVKIRPWQHSRVVISFLPEILVMHNIMIVTNNNLLLYIIGLYYLHRRVWAQQLIKYKLSSWFHLLNESMYWSTCKRRAVSIFGLPTTTTAPLVASFMCGS